MPQVYVFSVLHMTTICCQNVSYLNWSAAQAHVILSELDLVQESNNQAQPELVGCCVFYV